MAKPANGKTKEEKEVKEKPADEIEEREEEKEEEVSEEESGVLEEETDKKVAKAAKKAGISKKEAENIIGPIDPPADPEDRKAVAAYRKRVEKKLDQLLDFLKPKEPEDKEEEEIEVEEENTKKVPWYDRPIF